MSIIGVIKYIRFSGKKIKYVAQMLNNFNRVLPKQDMIFFSFFSSIHEFIYKIMKILFFLNTFC